MTENPMRWHVILEYDGTGLLGWQRQKDGMSAQQWLEEAIFSFSGEKTTCMAAGRTDAGVHALGMSAHFDLMRPSSPMVVMNALNAYLRFAPVRVLEAHEVPPNFHARFSAQKRYYLYRILNRKSEPVLMRGRVCHVRHPLDIKAMQKGADLLMGTHDFTSFRASQCQSKKPIKTLDRLVLYNIDEEVHLEAAAKSFLHHQIRNMVGTLIKIGLGKMEPENISTILAGKDRRLAGPTAPACGLYFQRAEYDEIN